MKHAKHRGEKRREANPGSSTARTHLLKRFPVSIAARFGEMTNAAKQLAGKALASAKHLHSASGAHGTSEAVAGRTLVIVLCSALILSLVAIAVPRIGALATGGKSGLLGTESENGSIPFDWKACSYALESETAPVAGNGDQGLIAKSAVAAGAQKAAASAETIASQTVEDARNYSARVPELLQYPEMPAGCEIYSLAAVIQSLGIDANPAIIVRDFLPYSTVNGDPATAYSGSPYIDGGGLPPAIVRAGNAYLESIGSSFRFADVTGTSFDDLLARAESGSPVLIWATVGLVDPGFSAPLSSYTFYWPEHCLVLLGENDDGTLSLMDPIDGYRSVDASWMRYLYELCGSMAVALA